MNKFALLNATIFLNGLYVNYMTLIAMIAKNYYRSYTLINRLKTCYLGIHTRNRPYYYLLIIIYK